MNNVLFVSESTNANETTEVQANTNEAGVYQLELFSCDIAPGSTLVEVRYADTVIHEIEVVNLSTEPCGSSDSETDTTKTDASDTKSPENAASVFTYSAAVIVASLASLIVDIVM